MDEYSCSWFAREVEVMTTTNSETKEDLDRRKFYYESLLKECKMSEKQVVKVLLVEENSRLPQKATVRSSGYDLYSCEDCVIDGLDRKVVSTGISVLIPNGAEIQIRSRSGLAAKNGIFVLNSPGTIDSDYTGIIKIILFNTSDQPFEVKTGDRIAQAVISMVPDFHLELTDQETFDMVKTERGSGGFGSTGK